MVAALAVGTTLFVTWSEASDPTAAQPTAHTVTSAPNSGWTEEEMRNATANDITTGPTLYVLSIVGGTVIAVGALVWWRRLSR